MPDIPSVDWEGSPESFTHEFLKNIPVRSRESQEEPAERFASVPNRLNLGRLEVFTPVSKAREDGYQSDCESDVSKVRNPTPLLISKVSFLLSIIPFSVKLSQVPTVMHTGFTNSFLTQYVNAAPKESSTRFIEAAGSHPLHTVEASQVGTSYYMLTLMSILTALGSMANLQGIRSSEPKERCVHKFCLRTKIQ